MVTRFGRSFRCDWGCEMGVFQDQHHDRLQSLEKRCSVLTKFMIAVVDLKQEDLATANPNPLWTGLILLRQSGSQDFCRRYVCFFYIYICKKMIRYTVRVESISIHTPLWTVQGIDYRVMRSKYGLRGVDSTVRTTWSEIPSSTARPVRVSPASQTGVAKIWANRWL